MEKNYENGKENKSMRLERSESRRLRCDPVGLSIGHRTGRGGGSLRQHQSRSAQDRGVVLVLLVRRLPGLALLVVLLEQLDRSCLLAQEVDHEGHREVVEPVPPRHLQDHIRPDQVVARIQHPNVALAAANVHKLQYVSTCYYKEKEMRKGEKKKKHT